MNTTGIHILELSVEVAELNEKIDDVADCNRRYNQALYERLTKAEKLIDLLMKRTGMAWADPEEQAEIRNELMNTEYERERFKRLNPDLPF